MIILSGGTKGGAGKTTIAVNVASWIAGKGRDVLLIDTDRQESASLWAAVRASNGIMPTLACVAAYGEGVTRTVRDLAGRYDDVVIDAGGHDSVELRAAMLACDTFLIPAVPGVFDYFAVPKLAEVIAAALPFNRAMKSFVVLNRIPTNRRCADEQEMREALERLEGVRVCNALLRHRKAFYASTAYGLGVCEGKDRDQKAVSEFELLMKEIVG
jgi:chromosome partitioning protein